MIENDPNQTNRAPETPTRAAAYAAAARDALHTAARAAARVAARVGARAAAWGMAALAFLGALPDRLWRQAQRIGSRIAALHRAHKAGDFPESDSLIVQVFLLLAGLFPMLRALAREFLTARRGGRVRAESGRRRRVTPKVFACAALGVIVVTAFFSLYTFAVAVSYNGETLDVVRGRAAAKAVVARVETVTSDALGSTFAFNKGALRYSPRLARRSEVSAPETLERDLTDEVGLVAYGYTLYINDEPVGATQYEGAIEALLEQLRQADASADTLSVDFIEDVRVEAGYVPMSWLVNLGRIAEIINSTKSGEVTYTVERGDTWGLIAGRNGMSNDELLALNPGYDINRLHIGDVLVLSKEVPYLTVRVTERQNYVEDVNYDIVYQDDATMYQGDTRVIKKGTYGTADVVADVIYVNGVETDRTVISQVMLTEPLTETRARGTKERPSWMATGSFRWPCSGRITSYFGYRNTGIRGATRNHMGIDIACSYGTPIYAADGGTVEYTGYKGAMGYTVVINHGNGFKTYYEHCSSFTCSSGQHVYKGQQIARVGRSGVASGAHCHFGVQRNGSYVNPLRYLS